MLAADLRRLAAPFAPADVEWKPGATTRDKSKGLAMCYISSRAVQNRLDDVCGPADWRNAFRPGPEGGVLCGISIYVERGEGSPGEWVTKWDGAESTDVEAVKGGLSGAMKRAAVQWGIGRYLYDMPAQWVRLDDRGRFAETPRIPREHLPDRPRTESTRAPEARRAEPRREATPPERRTTPPRNAPASRHAPASPPGAAPARRTGVQGRRSDAQRRGPAGGDGAHREPDLRT